MKTITPKPTRNAQTEAALAEMKAWLDQYVTDETDAFALVLVQVHARGRGPGGFVTETQHKTVASPATVNRRLLADIAHNAILDNPPAVEGASGPPKLKPLALS